MSKVSLEVDLPVLKVFDYDYQVDDFCFSIVDFFNLSGDNVIKYTIINPDDYGIPEPWIFALFWVGDKPSLEEIQNLVDNHFK